MPARQNGVAEASEAAQGAVVETAQMLRDAATGAGTAAQVIAAATGRQARAAVQSAYGTGNDMLGQVEVMARENIGLSLLIAGAVGYGLACLVKNARR